MAKENVPEIKDILCKKTRSGNTAFDELVYAVDNLSMIYTAFFEDIGSQKKIADLEEDGFNGLSTSFVRSLCALQNLRDDVFGYECARR